MVYDFLCFSNLSREVEHQIDLEDEGRLHQDLGIFSYRSYALFFEFGLDDLKVMRLHLCNDEKVLQKFPSILSELTKIFGLCSCSMMVDRFY